MTAVEDKQGEIAQKRKRFRRDHQARFRGFYAT